MTFTLERVHYIPQELRPGVLYLSQEFDIAVHLCACGCGAKIKTPLGPTEWSITDTKTGPSMNPSIGNWQQACQSHYVIDEGHVIWAERWTPRQILAGRQREEERRRAYYDALDRRPWRRTRRFLRWIKGLLKR